MTARTINQLTTVLFQEDLEVDQYDTDTLSHRLKYCLKLYGLSQSDLARKIGVKPQIIQYLCTKNVKSSRFTFELAEVLGVDYTWLSTGEGSMRPAETSVVQDHKIPLLTWIGLEKIILDIKNIQSDEYVYTTLDSSAQVIATKMDDISMEPRFEKGTTLIFDINCVPHDGDFVLVKLGKANLWVFRELVSNNDSGTELLPINNSIFKKITLEPDDRIMGVLIQTICDFKRDRE